MRSQTIFDLMEDEKPSGNAWKNLKAKEVFFVLNQLKLKNY